MKWQTKFGPGQFSAIPTDGERKSFIESFGTLIQENILSTYGAELDKGYSEVQFSSPLDANGNPIPTPLVSYKDNVKNFVQTGVTSIKTACLLQTIVTR